MSADGPLQEQHVHGLKPAINIAPYSLETNYPK